VGRGIEKLCGLLGKARLKIAAILVAGIFVVFPAAAWSQDAPIKVFLPPLLSKLDQSDLVYAVKVALSQAPFLPAPGPGADVLTLTAPDGVHTVRIDERNGEVEYKQFQFTVVFLRDGTKLGEAFETCPTKKLTDCTDQLILDAKTAAK